MEFFNSLNLTQIKGGTKLKQGDLGSVLSYSLTDENGQEITSFDTKTAYINLVLDDKIWFTTTTLVDISRVTFRIDKAIPIGLYYLEIKIDDYIFPSDRDSIILIEEGSTPYDLKELVPNYDINMTLKGILSDLSQKGIDISDLKRRIGNANAELIAARNGKSNLKTRIDDLENKTTAQLAQKANKDEVTNVMTPKGTLAYASLPTSGNQVGWYYYCPDGDGTHGAGNYVWNGTAWYFGGTGDVGYNLLKKDLEKIAYPFNYCDIANMTVGKLVNRSDGTLSGNSDGGYIKIPVSVGDTLYVYGFCNDFITNGNVGAVYKEDGTFFQGIYATGDAFILPYTASGYSEVKYALINCKAFGSKMMIFKEPYEDNIHIPYGANAKNIIPNRLNLNDKTVLVEGDSIMYGYGANGVGIGEILRDRYGFRLYKNAISGSTLAYVEGTENIRNRIVHGVKKPYDYIILDGGYNDYGKSLPLGSLMSGSYPYASTPDATTVIGAMELIFQHIKKNYPKTKIYFVTPHKVNRVWTQANSLNLTFKDYYDALISVCNLYSVPVIDLWNESGLITYFSEMKVFTKDNDGLHPTKEGYEEFYLPVFQKSLGI